MELNYLAKNKNTNEYFRIYGCNSEAEALRFIDTITHDLCILFDDDIAQQNINVIEN